MLVVQLVVLNFINNSHSHVFIVNSIVDTRFCRPSSIIHKEFVLTGPDAFMLSAEAFSKNSAHSPLSRSCQGGDKKLHCVSFTPSHIVNAAREQRMRPRASGLVRVDFATRNKYHAKGLEIHENPSIKTSVSYFEE
jgi:hypothetical protein